MLGGIFGTCFYTKSKLDFSRKRTFYQCSSKELKNVFNFTTTLELKSNGTPLSLPLF